MLKIEGLCKSFDSKKVLKDINLHIKKGEVITIIGPSGSGKSTLLRSINMLELPDEGLIQLDNIKVVQPYSSSDIKYLRANTAMIFQNYNLFNNKTAMENIKEPMLIRKKDPVYIEEKSRDLINRVGLSNKKNSYPKELSGGQQQRVGIARALAVEPKLLLLDEPSSALDPELVSEVIKLIVELSYEDYTMIIVTHDMTLAKIADRIMFMEDGEIREIYENKKGELANGKINSFLKAVN